MNAPFWVWWAAPVALTVLVWLGVLVASRDREGKDRRDVLDDDYTRFRNALSGNGSSRDSSRDTSRDSSRDIARGPRDDRPGGRP